MRCYVAQAASGVVPTTPLCNRPRAPQGLPSRPRLSVIRAQKTKEPAAPKAPVAAPVKGPAPTKAPVAPPPPPSPPEPEQYNPPLIKWPPGRSWTAIAWDKGVDTLDDIGRHVSRLISELPSTTAINKLVSGGDGRLRLEAKKPVILILGAGWGAHSALKVLDTERYEVVVVSPRNHFLFTPMLPSTAVGTVEFRSLLEPIRSANPFATYFEASCDVLDLENKVALCTSAVTDEAGRRPQFEVPYDAVIVSVGEQPATFGTPGVDKYCFFMKEVSDSVGLRKRIQETFELACLPGMSEDDIRKALHFVVVGGGPTGVEFAGTLSDFLREDLKREFPQLMKYVRVTLLNSANTVLTQFNAQMQKHALNNFKKVGVDVRMGVRVVEVTQDEVVVSDKAGGQERMKYGVCVWSAGNAPRPLVAELVQQIPGQMKYQLNPRALKLAVDPFLRIIGAKDAMAVGDCTTLVGDRLPATAQVAGQQGAYAAHVLNRGFRPGNGGMDQLPPSIYLQNLGWREKLLAAMMGVSIGKPDQEGKVYYKKPFEFLSLGLLAYVGNERALTQIELGDLANLRISGQFAYLLWKSVYITKQVSFRNRVLILFDWLKAQVFGRDLSQF